MPVRVEVGPRDLASGVVTLARRDAGTKITVPVAEAAPRVLSLLEHIQGELLAEATARLRVADGRRSKTVDEAVEAAATGFARLPWAAVGTEGEDRMRADRRDRALPASRGRITAPRRRRTGPFGHSRPGLLTAPPVYFSGSFQFDQASTEGVGAAHAFCFVGARRLTVAERRRGR